MKNIREVFFARPNLFPIFIFAIIVITGSGWAAYFLKDGSDQSTVSEGPSPETQETSFKELNTYVDEVLHRRVWTSADAEKVRPLFALLSAEQRNILMQRVFQSLNRQELKIESNTGIF